jgi:hypothetical protein
MTQCIEPLAQGVASLGIAIYQCHEKWSVLLRVVRLCRLMQ